jgi:hypothetical protein
MAQASRKRVNDYLNLKSTNEYLEALSSDTMISASQLVIIVKGGDNSVVQQGTWAHKLIAVDFAQWCSVGFRIWANKTLLQTIVNTAHPETQEMDELELLQITINQMVEQRKMQKLLLAKQEEHDKEIINLKNSVDQQIEHNKVVDAELDRIENCL